MFFPEARVRVFLHAGPVDMRKSFDGPISLARHALGQEPLSGHVFVFVNRRASYLKALYWDRTGFCLWSKRLERRRFLGKARGSGRELDATELKLLLEGIEPVRRRLRYRPPATRSQDG